MLFGVHFKRSTHDVGYAFQNTFPFICHGHTCLIGTYSDFIWCVLFACVELAWVVYNEYTFGFCVVLILWMACDANQQCIFPSLSRASPCLDDKILSEAWTCTWFCDNQKFRFSVINNNWKYTSLHCLSWRPCGGITIVKAMVRQTQIWPYYGFSCFCWWPHARGRAHQIGLKHLSEL